VGDFGNTDFSSNIADLRCAADHLREHFEAPALLVGHSLGGAAVLAAAHRIPEVRAVATIGAPADPEHVARLFDGNRSEIEERGEAEVVLGGRRFRIRREFLEDIAMQPQADRIAKLGAALLVMHSPIDEVVAVDNARRIFDAARHPKSFISLDGADHLLRNHADAEFVATVLGAWAARYTTDPAARPGAGQLLDPPPPGVVVVTEDDPDSGTAPFGQRITVGRHVLPADEPEPIGTDSGPNPYDLLLAALGACTSMTVRMYAQRKQWPLDQVSVALRHSRIHASDCAECETKIGLLDHVERTIRFTGTLDEQQRAKLLEIADKCPVHRTLHSEIVINTTEDSGHAE
jgi:putative redox protein